MGSYLLVSIYISVTFSFIYLQLPIIGGENNSANPSDGQMEIDSALEAINAKTMFVETDDRKIAYFSMGKAFAFFQKTRLLVLFGLG